jgi:carboxylesterase type B
MVGTRTILAVVAAFAAYYYFKVLPKASKPSPIVEISSGSIQGIISSSREGRPFYEYLGIPYAQPPVGDLRYEPPNPPKSWTGVRKANKLGAECAQFNILAGGVLAGEEDCLFVNVFTPKLKDDGKLLPTMVWIHGGLFVAGSSNMYRPDFFMDEDVVLVTLNYRLAALGFLNTGDGLVLGNMGLKDQSLALKWVQQNIKKFGGDPNQVTIFGESAGGASVHFQLLSKQSEGLFHRAISQSGVALNPWAIRGNVAAQAKRYAKSLNCPTEDLKDLVKCLKKKPVKELLEAHRESSDHLRDPITIFGPTIEVPSKSAFMTEHPRELISKGKASRVPFMTGINSHEGLLSSPVVIRSEEMLKKFDTNFNKVMPNFIFYSVDEGKSMDSDMEKIRDFYFGKGERIDTPAKLENYTNLMTDWVWAVGAKEVINLQSQFSPVYAYYYTYNGKFALSNFILALKGKYPAIVEVSVFLLTKWINENIFNVKTPVLGPCHGDEMALQFTLTGLSDTRQGHPDYDMSRKVVKLWTSFASNVTPLKAWGPKWSPVDPKAPEISYLKIDKKAEIITQPNQDRMGFWKKLRG